MRAEFLAMISHELRVPLSSIRGSATALLDEASSMDPAEMHQFHRIILDQTDRMRALITDLLDVARIETGTLAVQPAPADVAALVDEARNSFLSGGGRETLHIELPPDLPAGHGGQAAHRPGARQPAQQRVQKFAPVLSHQGDRHVRQDLHIAVSVSDQGRGVPAERLPHLFQKFYRPADEDLVGDTGLGLAICKGIVEAHGGRIWAESDGPGLGARFTFTIPLDGASDAGAMSRSTHPTDRRSEREEKDTAAHPGGRRRPAGATVCSRRPLEGGLSADRDRRPHRRVPPGRGE